ncbi:MAG: glycosylhydrolase-like jelly roll fold domain-containing protein [Pirellulaceae bacterium]
MAALMDELRALPNVRTCASGLEQELDARSPGLTSPIEFVSGEFPMLQLRRRIDERDFFWLVNNSDQPRQCVVALANTNGLASIWDCETGKICPLASVAEGTNSRISLAFQPHEAFWLVLDPAQPVCSEPVLARPNEPVLLTVDGPWNVRVDQSDQPKLEHAVNLPAALTGPGGVAHDLTLWETWPELPGNFSGLVDYTKTVTLPATAGNLALTLDLGKVHHFAEVWVNGQHLGTRLWPPHVFRTDAWRPGANELRIRVGNLINNNYQMPSPSGLLGPVTVKTF